MLDESALADAAAGEEEAEDIAMTAIEVINLRGHIATVPGVAVVEAVVAAYLEYMGVVAGYIYTRPAVAHFARAGHNEHAARLAVAHHGGIAMTLVEVAAAKSHDGATGSGPGLSAVMAVAHLDADVAHRTNIAPTGGIGHARAVVGEGYDVVVIRHDGGNAVVLVAGGVGLPQRGLCARGSGDDGHAKGCKDCLHN